MKASSAIVPSLFGPRNCGQPAPNKETTIKRIEMSRTSILESYLKKESADHRSGFNWPPSVMDGYFLSVFAFL
jgi:hypothetical protein